MVAKKTAAKKPPIFVPKKLIKPEGTRPLKNDTFKGRIELKKMMLDHMETIDDVIAKFRMKHCVSVVFLPRFNSFKLIREKRHVDWITFDDLMKMYNTGIAPIGVPLRPQRPYEQDRVY